MVDAALAPQIDTPAAVAAPLTLQDVRRVAVVRALPGLGDALCAVPALRALRAALPWAEIALIGLPATRPLFARFDRYVDELLDFPGYPGLPEQPVDDARLEAFVAAARARRFDLALQLHGSGAQSNGFTLLLGARTTAGLYPPGDRQPSAGLWAAYPARGHELRRCLRVVELIGAAPCGEELEFPLLPADRAALARLPGAEALRPGGYAVLHPGASVPARRWPVERFARVARALAQRGLAIVLTGSAGEAELTRDLARLTGVPALDLAGETDLGALAALLAEARLLVCNDTGVSHLAAALRTPSVVLFGATDVERWAPLDQRRHRRVFQPDSTPASVEQALAAIAALLAERRDGD